MKTEIRVLQIVPNMQQGGIENFIMNVLRNIDRNRYKFDFLVHYSGDFFFDKEIENYGCKIYKLSVRNDKNYKKYFKELKLFFKNNQYDVVHCHMMSVSYIELKYAKKYSNAITICHSHNTSTDKSIKGFIKSIFIKFADRYADFRLACSNKAGNYAFGRKKYYVINNGININRFKYNLNYRIIKRNELKIKQDEILIGNVGRMSYQKNQLLLLDVFSRMISKNENLKLLIIGDGELKTKLIDKIDELKISDYVILLPNQKDIEKYYSAMDIFVLSSRFEGLPLTGVEAQINGLICAFNSTITGELKMSTNVSFFDFKSRTIVENLLSLIDGVKHNDRKMCNDLLKYDINSIIDNLVLFYER